MVIENVFMIGGGSHSAVGPAHVTALRLAGLTNIEGAIWSRDFAKSLASSEIYCGSTKPALNGLGKMGMATSSMLVSALPPTELKTSLAPVISKAKYLFQEKPSAVSSSEFNELIEMRSDHETWFFNYTYLGYPMVRQMQDHINKGNLGKILHLEIRMPQETFLRVDSVIQDWRKVDGAIPTVSLDLGTHVLSILGFLTGSFQLTNFSSYQTSASHHRNLVSGLFVIGSLSSGASVALSWSKEFLGYRNGLSIGVFGEEASVYWEQERPDVMDFRDNKGNHRVLQRGSPEVPIANERRYNRFKAGHPTGYIEALANMYEDVIEFSRRGERASALLTAQDSLQILLMLEQLHLSALGTRGLSSKSENR